MHLKFEHIMFIVYIEGSIEVIITNNSEIERKSINTIDSIGTNRSSLLIYIFDI